MKKHVLQFISTLNTGGAETLVRDYALNLDKEKFDVRILINSALLGTANEKILKENGIIIYSMYDKPCTNIFIKIHRKIFRKKHIVKKLNNINREWKIDIIHNHLVDLKYLEKFMRKHKDIKCFYTLHSKIENFLDIKKYHYNFMCAKKLIDRNNMKLIGLHDDMRKDLNKLFNINNSVVLNNAINIDKFQNVSFSKIEIRQKLHIPVDAFVLGHVGRFSEEKNHILILKTFLELLKSKPNAVLLLVGQGELEEDIVNFARKYNFIDKLYIFSNRSDVNVLLKAMDFFIFPSLYEGLGISLIEAQISGLQCIISNNVPKSAIISNLVIRKSLDCSPKEWAEDISDFNINKIIYKDVDKWNIKNVVKQLENLYIEK